MIITVLAVVAAVGLTLMATMAILVKQMNGANKEMSQGLSHLQDQLGGLIIDLRQLNDDLRSRNITMQRKLDDLGEFTEVMKNILKVEFWEDKDKRTAMFSAHLASIMKPESRRAAELTRGGKGNGGGAEGLRQGDRGFDRSSR